MMIIHAFKLLLFSCLVCHNSQVFEFFFSFYSIVYMHLDYFLLSPAEFILFSWVSEFVIARKHGHPLWVACPRVGHSDTRMRVRYVSDTPHDMLLIR